jgi:glutamate racemase
MDRPGCRICHDRDRLAWISGDAGVRIALVDSGLGVLPVAAACLRRQPDLELVLSMDPDHMPYGSRRPDEIASLIERVADAAEAYRPDVLVLACNTASVSALSRLRAKFEPEVPVVGTVPAVKPAAESGFPFAVWATSATTGSPYQRDLLARFASGVRSVEVACPGLAEAVEWADEAALAAALGTAAASTPAWVRAVVLGCTQYPLVKARIGDALGPAAVLLDSSDAVAAQAIRRLRALPRLRSRGLPGERLVTLASGRRVELPERAMRYAEGRALARLAG